MDYSIYYVKTDTPLKVKDYFLHSYPSVCILDFDKLICEKQVTYALDRLSLNRTNKSLISNSWPIDLLLELAGTTQIKKALNIFEITKTTSCILIIADTKQIFTEDLQFGLPKFQTPTNELLKIYNLPQSENICQLIITKGATARI